MQIGEAVLQTLEETVCFRFLDESEYHKIEHIFKSFNSSLPIPKLSRIAIAEIESTQEIIGFFVWQLLPHAEPIWIKEEHRNTKIWLKLASMLEPLTRRKDTFIVAESEDVIRMCEALGLKQVLYPVYVKEASKEETEGV